MNRGYRASSAPPAVVVDYPLMRPIYAALAVVAFAFIALVILALSHRVDLRCEGPTGTCTATDRGLFHDGAPHDVRVEALEGAMVLREHGGTSVVALLVHGKSVSLSNVRESFLEADKERMVDDVRGFVRDPKPGFRTGYGSRWANAAPALVVDVLVAVLVVWTGRWRVRFTVDRHADEILFEQLRPFLRARAFSAPLGSIRGVAIDSEPGPRRSVRQRMVLVHEDGRREPLPATVHSFANDLERASSAMNDAIRAAREPSDPV
jgi:hypothetical protein